MLGHGANISWRFNAMHNPDDTSTELEDTGTSPIKTGGLTKDGDQTGLAAKRGLSFEEEVPSGDLLPPGEGLTEDPNAMALDSTPPIEPGGGKGLNKDRTKRSKKDGVSSNNSKGSADSSKGSVRSQ
jgi:hypothetical protein